MRRATRLRATAVLAAAALALAGCGDGDGDEGTSPPAAGQRSGGLVAAGERAPRGVEPAPHPLGIKPNWSRVDASGRRLAPLAGGFSFVEVDWCQVEPVEGQRDWRRLDRVVKRADALGLELAVKVRVGDCWATGRLADASPVVGRQPSRLPVDLDAYAAFLAELATRHHPTVTTFAVENEVGARNFWAGTPQDYVALLDVAVPALRQAGDDVRVLDSGLDSMTWVQVVLRDLLADGRADDALALHAEVGRRRPGRLEPARSAAELRDQLASGRPAEQLAFADAVLAVADRVDAVQVHWYEPWWHLEDVVAAIRERAPSTTVEVWELGIAWDDGFDAAHGAVETTKLVAEALRLGVRRIAWLPDAWTPGGARDDELWRGLWEPDGTPRPGASAYTFLAERLAGYTGARGLDDELVAAGLRGVVVDAALDTTIAWSDGAPVRLRLGPLANAWDHLGELVELPVDGTVTVGTAPLLVEGVVDGAALLP